jgi:hypothetical protein
MDTYASHRILDARKVSVNELNTYLHDSKRRADLQRGKLFNLQNLQHKCVFIMQFIGFHKT